MTTARHDPPDTSIYYFVQPRSLTVYFDFILLELRQQFCTIFEHKKGSTVALPEAKKCCI